MSQYSDKSILVVGANGGLGVETTKFLTEDGFGRIVMAGRSEERIRAARDRVLATASPGPGTVVTTAGGFDMTEPDRIKAAVAALPDQRFDVVFLAAGGVVFTDQVQSTSWNGLAIERTVFQNVIGGHVTLSALLRRGLLAPGARVVVAGGEGARGIPGLIEKPTFATVDDLRRYLMVEPGDARSYNPMNAIGVSKFLSALWVSKLTEIEPSSFDAIWFSPGLTADTNGLAGAGAFRRWFLEKIGFKVAKLIGKAQSATAGGRKNADCLEGKVGRRGDILGAPEGKALGELVDQRPMNPDLSNSDLADEFWDLLAKIDGPFGA